MRAARVWFLPPTHLQARTPPPPPPPTPAPFRLLPLLFLSLFFKQPLDFLGVGRTCPTIAGTFRVCLPLVCRSHAEPVSSAGCAVTVLGQRFSVPLPAGNGGSRALLRARCAAGHAPTGQPAGHTPPLGAGRGDGGAGGQHPSAGLFLLPEGSAVEVHLGAESFLYSEEREEPCKCAHVINC